ncbi:tyrosine-type recombinase/integrase [Undibacterium sp. Ji42W]|uniref:tyrosine-type recombinase/integrase n=1 Tax=Undibacterium sp. Ji42W TaxID=3413039 RepID=UPI003BF2E442
MAKINFTAGRVKAFKCEAGKSQCFLWDTTAHGLGLRVTAKNARTYIFQAKLNGETIRMSIGSPSAWTIDDAQAEARRLQVLVESGKDPRQVKADELAEAHARKEAKTAKEQAAILQQRRELVTLADVWPAYLENRKPHWGDGHYENHIKLAAAGGVKHKRGNGVTVAAPLAALMPMRLIDLTSANIAAWLTKETLSRPTNAAQSFRILRAFIGWAATMPAYKDMVSTDACKSHDVKEAIPKNKSKSDTLQREQLALWFEAVGKIGNPVISAYLQALLITGARRRELSSLRWEDVDFQWNSLTIRDKVEGERTIPLTPYISQLLNTLPRRNGWVFSSPAAADGKLTEPRIAHTKALKMAGLPHVSLHGLRRSFGTLCEWVECPVGVSAQIMGHKPSATAEKHYRIRPIDLLRMWHTKIESWLLEQAHIDFVPTQTGLRVISNHASNE